MQDTEMQGGAAPAPQAAGQQTGAHGSDEQHQEHQQHQDRRPPRMQGGRRPRPYFKKKVCRICSGKVVIDYKNAEELRRFVTDTGKILPRRVTGTCAKHQRAVAQAVKRARILSLLPYDSRHI